MRSQKHRYNFYVGFVFLEYINVVSKVIVIFKFDKKNQFNNV